MDREISIAIVQAVIAQRFEAQLVTGIRCIGYQLAQEDLFI
jgi:hypothetical protein